MEIKNRQKVLLIVAASALALLVGDSLILSPLIASWHSRSERIADLEAKVSAGESLVKHEHIIRGHWEQMRTNALPADVSIAEGQLLRSFERWERSSGITRSSIKPQWKDAEDDYKTLECGADYTGDIDRLTRFLYEVEKDPLGLKVDDVEISSRDDAGRQLSLRLQVSGLLLTPTNAPPAAAPAKS